MKKTLQHILYIIFYKRFGHLNNLLFHTITYVGFYTTKTYNTHDNVNERIILQQFMLILSIKDSFLSHSDCSEYE